MLPHRPSAICQSSASQPVLAAVLFVMVAFFFTFGTCYLVSAVTAWGFSGRLTRKLTASRPAVNARFQA